MSASSEPHNMIVAIQGSFGHEEYTMCISFSSSVHGLTDDKGPLCNLCGSKSTEHQSSLAGSLYLLQHCF